MEIDGTLGPRPVAEPSARLSSARAAILARLVGSDEPLTVKEVSSGSGQHANTVREHLEALVELGLVERQTSKPVGRGRPAITYTAVEDADTVHGQREYMSLVDALASHIIATSDDPGESAISAGRAWAKTMPGEPGAEDVMVNMGFRPVTDDEGMRLTQCPLLASARRNPDVVCNVHLGLVRELTGEDLELRPFAPGGCLIHRPATES